VVDDLVERACGMSLKNVKHDNHHSSHASQAIKYQVMWFCS